MVLYQKALDTWQAWQIDTPEKLEARLDSFRVLFAYHSGKIENEAVTYADTREIFEKGQVCGYTGPTRALFEQQNQKLCYDFLKDKIIARQPLTLPLVLEVHRILASGTYDERRYVVNGERPGEFKHHDYVTGVHEVGAYPEDVPNEMQTLLDEVNTIGRQKPLLAAAYLHAAMENIHPFADGNGRVGRTLMNYWLMINNYPPIVVHQENRTAYYRALQCYDETEELQPLMDFLQQETIQTWRRQMPSLMQDEKPPRTSLAELCQSAKASATAINTNRIAPTISEPEQH